MDPIDLELRGTVGINGRVRGGLVVHPDGDHVLYPLGSVVVKKHVSGGSQSFFEGLDGPVTCVTVSPSGKYVAAGEHHRMSTQVDVVVWDYETGEIVHRLSQHKVVIQAVSFSQNDQYIASMGGREDNRIIVWDMTTGKTVCGSLAARGSAGFAEAMTFVNTRNDQLVSGGEFNLTLWQIDPRNRHLLPQECRLGKLTRVITALTLDPQDEFLYCATSTGDALQISMKTLLFKVAGPPKGPFENGLQSIALVESGDVLVGSGAGTVAVLSRDKLKILREVHLQGGVTSISTFKKGSDEMIRVGTDFSNVYEVRVRDFDAELLSSCHPALISGIEFPYDYSELFATCGNTDIRIWNANTMKELLRIVLPNLDCSCVTFMRDGKSLVSGWSDGNIRAFYPESGKLMYTVLDAQPGGVTAINTTSDCNHVVSGGADGSIRIWNVSKSRQTMVASLKEHKSAVTDIKLSQDNQQCVSSSADGSTIIWDLARHVRLHCLFSETFFKAVVFHPDETQVLTAGSDKKITYWDTYDGTGIRELTGSKSGCINSIDIAADGESFILGGADKLLKVFSYDEGKLAAVGTGHSGEINAVKIAPNQKFCVSVGDEGGIFVWDLPSKE